jgi:hypothetical protein
VTLHGPGWEPVFFKGTMNGHIYLNQCIKKVLLPVIKKYHKIEDVIFWPDKATSLYANEVTSFLHENNIDFVQKDEMYRKLEELKNYGQF